MENKRVLVIDDEISIRKFISACLQTEGYEVFSAADGQEALQLAEKVNPDLYLVDIMMPAVNGYEFCRRIRRSSTAPVIMLSARADEADIENLRALGASDYIVKPFGVEELIEHVRAVLRRPRVRFPNTVG